MLKVVFAAALGCSMLYVGVNASLRRRAGRPVRRPSRHGLAHKLPLQMRFRKSRLYVSIIPPLVIGFPVGALAAAMGIGGGLILVPAMNYLLGTSENRRVGKGGVSTSRSRWSPATYKKQNTKPKLTR